MLSFLFGDAGIAGFGNTRALGAACHFSRIVLCRTVFKFFKQRLFGGGCSGTAVGEGLVLGSWQVWFPLVEGRKSSAKSPPD
jgi:hypothetical protein